MASSSFPYHEVPSEARWRSVMDGKHPSEINPHVSSNFKIHQEDKIASAGSCFAQRIAEALKQAGYNYMSVETGSPFQTQAERERQGYGLYSARYGNVYTALQLLQLFRRAFGQFEPSEPLWRLPNGNYVDPFRPSIQPDGFASESDCLWDRQAHLAAVRRMFEEVNVFVYTLGLTESWLSTVDGAVFPVCPGSSLGGEFSPGQYIFHNFSVAEVCEHMNAFVIELKEVNPHAKILLTVSPVPLLATYEARHVLQATVYSKSVLRVAAEETVRRHAHAQYFASYEIVNHTGDSRAYFQDDLRAVTPDAVKHVINCFHQQFTDYVVNTESIDSASEASRSNLPEKEFNKPVCDEDLVMEALADQAQQERHA